MNRWRWLGVVGGILLAACRTNPPAPGAGAPVGPSAQAARSQGQGTEASPRTLTVNGMGTVRARPDQAVVTLGVETSGETLASALAENNRRAAAVLDALKAYGVAENDIQTASFQIQIEEPRDPQTGRPIGPRVYRVVHVYTAIFRDLEAVGAGVDAAVTAGANRVEGIAFQIGSPDRLAMEARRLAAEDAKARAQTLAAALGAQLGAVRMVRETSFTRPIPVPMFRMAAAEAAAVPVAAGELEIAIEVEVTWELR
ncbi:SIMPL domain-containing protein [Thermoflexus hugenholtzii]